MQRHASGRIAKRFAHLSSPIICQPSLQLAADKIQQSQLRTRGVPFPEQTISFKEEGGWQPFAVPCKETAGPSAARSARRGDITGRGRRC